MAGAWLLGEDIGERDEPRKAVLVAVREEETAGAPGTELSLAELRRLADTDGLDVVEEVVRARGRPDPATYVGSGKAEELADTVPDALDQITAVHGVLHEIGTGTCRNCWCSTRSTSHRRTG